MGLDTDNLFSDEEDEFFTSEAEGRLSPRLRIKLADEDVTSSIVMQNDDELFMSLQSESTYKFSIYIQAEMEDNTPDIDMTVVGPAGSSGKYWVVVNEEAIEVTFTPLEFAAEFNGNQGIGTTWYRLDGWIKTASTAGNLQYQFAAQNDVVKFCRVKADSWIEVTKQ